MMNAIADRPVRRKHILIVDDNPENLRQLKRIFSVDMYAIHEAMSGEAALRLVRLELPDIVVLDATLSDVDSYQVCCELKRDVRTQDIPVVFVGSGEQIAEKSKAFEMGGVDFITKPFQEEEVLLRLKTHLGLYDRQKLLEQRVAERSAAVEQLAAQLDRERQEHAELQQRLAVLESVASFPLIESKLTPPLLSDHFFRIERLERNFEQACAKRLISVVAPAGYGKSTILARLRLHVVSRGWIVGWISLDSEHDEPTRFLHYLVAALQGAAVRAGAPSLTPPVAGASTDRQLRLLCADLAEFRQVVALFLEDFQHITNRAVHEIVNWLVDAGPPCLKVFIASRARLPLKLSKLKLANELYAFAAADLCLHMEEVGPFVAAVSAQRLEPAQASLLYYRTEGWPAGLQLASLALNSGEHVNDVIEGLAGGESDIAAYIGEMVLVQMPPRLAEFLCLTALFTRFSLALCEEFFPPREATELLGQVKAQNLFLIALDNRQEWFRYHPLFRDYLKSRLLLGGDQQVKATYLKASAWFVRHGLMHEAISYALAGGDYASAADRASRYAFILARKHGDYATVISWIRQLPPQYVAQRPHLQLASAWAQVFSLHFPEAEDVLANIERLLASGEMARRMAFNDTHIRSVEKKLTMVRSVYYAMMDRTELAGPLCLEWMARWGQGDPIDILTQ